MTGDQDLSNLTEHQFNAVLAVARHRSFTAAASDLGLSQPTLTRRIANLEAMIGAPAFDRTTRSVRLTPVGRELVGVAARVVEDIRLTRDRMAEIVAAGNTHVVVSTLSSLASVVMPAATVRFLGDHPGVEVVVREGSHDRVVEDVLSGSAEFGVAYVDGLPHGLRADPLRTERYVLVVRPSHRLAARRSVSLDDLPDEPLVGFASEAQLRRLVDSVARDRGLRLRYVAQTCGFASAFAFVAAGVGSAIAPAAAVRVAPVDGLAAIPIDEPDLVRDIGIIRSAERDLRGAAAALGDDVRAALQPAAHDRVSRSESGRRYSPAE